MNSPRKGIFRIHFNKQRANKGYPWTVHWKKQCIPAKQIILGGHVKSEWKPKKKNNPRAFFTGVGLVTVDEKGKAWCYGF